MRLGLLKSAGSRLDEIDVELATMGGLVEQQVADAINAFDRGNVNFAAEVRDRDRIVDDHERSIEQRVIEVMEQHRPTGDALRRAMTALRVAAEMERVADLAKNIAKRTIVIADLEGDQAARASIAPVVANMGRRALAQLAESLDCLFQGNAMAAKAVRDADDQIDDLYNSIFREILVSMSQYSAGVVLGTHLVFIAKNFERIGDHATNIAERAHYSLTGTTLEDERPKTDHTSSKPVSAL